MQTKKRKLRLLILVFACLPILSLSNVQAISDSLEKARIDSVLFTNNEHFPMYLKGLSIQKSKSNHIYYFTRFAAYYLQKNDTLKTAHFLNKAKLIATIYFHQPYLYREISQLAYRFNMNGDYDNALFLYNEACEYYKRTNKLNQLAHLLTSKSSALIMLDKEKVALEDLLYAENIMNNKEDYLYIGTICQNISGVYAKIGQDSLSEIYLIKAIDAYKNLTDKSYLAIAYSNLAISLKNNRKTDEALFYFNLSDSIAKRINDERLIAANTLNLGNIFDETGDKKTAKRYYKRSLSLCNKLNMPYGKYLNYINIASLLIQVDKIDNAIQFLNKADTLQKQYAFDNESELNKNLFEAYKANGELHNALFHLEKYTTIEDSINEAHKHREIMEIQSKYDAKNKKAKILSLEKQQKQQKIRIILISSLSLLMLFIFVSSIIWLNQRRIIAKQKAVIMNNKLSSLNNTVVDKNKELTSYSLYISQMQELIRNLINKISEVKRNSDEKDSQLINEITSMVNTNKMVGRKFWQEYDKQFKAMNFDFLHRLTMKHPELTNTEIRICSFLYLNMTTKEIANMTNRSVRTVENFRYRIRKKIKQDKNINLTTYIHSI